MSNHLYINKYVHRKWLLYWVHFWLFIGSASVLVWPLGYNLGPLILSLTGLYLLISRAPTQQSVAWPKLLFGLAVVCWLFGLLAPLIHIFNGTHWHIYAPHAPFILYPFILWIYFKVPHIDGRWLIRGAAISGILGFLYSAWIVFGIGEYRPTLHRSPISYGNTGLLVSAVCFLGLQTTKLKFEQFVLIVAGFAGLGVAFLSGSRGGWLAIPILIASSWMVLRENKLLAWRIPVFLILGIIFGTALIHPNSQVHKRIKIAVANVYDYEHSGNVDTSVGARLAMWEFAASIASERPLLGYGFQGTRDRWKEAIDSGEYTSKIGGSHFHNEMIQFYVNTGLVGLLLVIFIYAFSLRFFYRQARRTGNENNPYAILGLTIVLMYLVFGLTNGVWSNNSNRQIFMFLIMNLSGLAACYAVRDGINNPTSSS